MDAAAVENEGPPAADEEEQDQQQQGISNFNRELDKLERNANNTFRLLDAIDDDGEDDEDARLTIAQANSLSNALSRNKSVERFEANLDRCPIAAIAPFVDYIGSSARLKSVVAKYHGFEQGCRTQLDRLFHAVRDNPGIQEFTTHSLASPESTYDLLARTKSLTGFGVVVRKEIGAQHALSIAAGFCRNSSITKFTLHPPAYCDHVDTILSRLGASSIESLALRAHVSVGDPNILCPALSDLVLCMPSLKALDVSGRGGESLEDPGRGAIGKLFLHLRHPACTGIKTMKLEWLHQELLVDTMPGEKANTSIENLSLADITFQVPSAVHVLWNVVGLRELLVESPTCESQVLLTKEDVSLLEYSWAELIRRNKNLRKVTLGHEACAEDGFIHGVLEGARRHPSLAILHVEHIGLQRKVGTLLCQVLVETPSLKELYFEHCRLIGQFSTLLVEGLCQNESLEILHFKLCWLEADSLNIESRFIIGILESLLVNQTLRVLQFEGLYMSDVMGRSFLEVLAQVLKRNKSLVKLMVSMVDFRSETLTDVLNSLKKNKTLKSLILDDCAIDNPRLIALSQALESEAFSSLEEIGFPRNFDVTEQVVEDLEQGRQVFLRTLERMLPNIQKVHCGDTLKFLDNEARALILRAVKENKNIRVLSDSAIRREGGGISRLGPEIEYYLKLNRFGRRLLDSTNVLVNLWPTILSRMTRQPEDADALFYFVREYFSRQGATQNNAADPTPHLQEREQEQQQEQQQPPQKKARVD